MGLKNKNSRKYYFFVVVLILFPLYTFAAWNGPLIVLSGEWGERYDGFGIEHGESFDQFPTLDGLLGDGSIVISDIVNKRTVVYASDGSFKEKEDWVEQELANGRIRYNHEKYLLGCCVQGYDENGNLWTGGNNRYALTNRDGELLKTTNERPLELGRLQRKYLSPNNFLYSVQYPDATISVALPWELLRNYQRVNPTTIVLVARTPGPDKVYRASSCGKVLGEMQMPETKWTFVGMSGVEEVNALEVEYGNPVIGPNGDVYAWKRTPENYSILKWTWQDDPNPPANVPDAPTNLTVAAGATGLTLRWKAPLQDPGCVSEYEIARSAVSQGAFTPVGTAPSGTFTYTDTTAEAGLTYYYKVRAKGGSGYSEYTNEASGVRQ